MVKPLNDNFVKGGDLLRKSIYFFSQIFHSFPKLFCNRFM